MLITKNAKNMLVAIVLLISWCSSSGYNLDTQFPITYSGSKGSYFGYSTALHYNKWGPVALVGAPKSNTTTFSGSVYEPGTLFKCNITENVSEQTCQEVVLMKEGAIEINRDYDFAYQDMKDGMWLGVSLDVRPSQTESYIVTCGHRWRNQFHYRLHLVNGVCYVINGDLEETSIRKLLPLTERSMQYGREMGRVTEYNHAHGQVGMSAVFSEDGSNLILGAPGIWAWSGSVVNYFLNYDNKYLIYNNPVTPPPSYEIEFNAYFGYSVTTGRFFQSGTELYAVGAPRDAGNHGKVYVIRIVEGMMRILQTKQGVQLGEYFGASVLGVNLNSDSYTDLVVGAPLNSMESAGDEGKVYVYISNGKELKKRIGLTGDKKASARFGTALANIGDLNQDGYTDIAIGAPYEDGQGAVYIYHGSRSGVESQYAQKITATAINLKLSGFGIHISRGVDIDENGYPDILVGSYNSANALLFRTRPVIQVFSEIIFTPKRINMNQTACETGGENLTCFQVDVCLRYRGKHAPVSLIFEFSVSIQDHRGFFIQNTHRVFTSQEIEVLDVNLRLCLPFHIYLRPDIKDVLTPIPVQFSHGLQPPGRSKRKFYKDFPIYHPTSRRSIISDIAFQTGCGDENECKSDLSVSATRTEPPEGRFIILGNASRVSVVITVQNNGEPAYLSELLIYLPPEMPSINQDFCEAGSQHSNASLICNLGNPLRIGTKVKINIKLDATKIPPNKKYLQIQFKAITLSTEMYPDDNTEILPIHLETVSDIGIKGVPFHDQIMYDSTKSASPVISHTYIVRNHGPSPLQMINIVLRVPRIFVTAGGEEPFLYFTGIETDSEMQMTIPSVCNVSSLDIVNVQRALKEQRKITNDDKMLIEDNENISISFPPNNSIGPPSDLTKNSDVQPDVIESDEGNRTSSSKPRRNTVINCDSKNVECVELRCSAAPFFDRRKFAQISVDFQLNYTVLNNQPEPWYRIEFITTGSISVKDSTVTELHDHPTVAQVKTVFLHEGPPPPEELASWIIFVSVGVGVILLLLILLLLIKVGFFRRKEKDEMKKLLHEGKKEENVDQENKDTEVLEES